MHQLNQQILFARATPTPPQTPTPHQPSQSPAPTQHQHQPPPQITLPSNNMQQSVRLQNNLASLNQIAAANSIAATLSLLNHHQNASDSNNSSGSGHQTPIHSANIITTTTTANDAGAGGEVAAVNNDGEFSSSFRPKPKFFTENATFSTKKQREKQTPKLVEHIVPPKPPIKSCPPVSRLKPRKPEYEGARVISFVNKNNNNNKSMATQMTTNNNSKKDDDFLLSSKHYDENKKGLFFEQCFIIEGILGYGSFGKVYKVKSKEDSKYYAIKKSRERFKGHQDRIRKLEEVAKHEELPPHPGLVKFYRAWEEKQRLYIQIELCQTSLSSYAEKHHNIPESVIWQFLVDLLPALKHLHDRKLIHMDIKPENIFISFDGFCKLGDFGLVIDMSRNDLREVQEGDPKYLAPEILISNNNITCAADIFSLGMTILELATDLDLPRGGDPWHQLRNGQIPSEILATLSKDLIQIIQLMIEPDHLKRATANQLLDMPSIKQLLGKRRLNYFVKKQKAQLREIVCRLKLCLLTVWHFVLKPLRTFGNIFGSCTNVLKSLIYHTSTTEADMDDEKKLVQHTSTPKKLNINVPIITTMHAEDDDNQNPICCMNDTFSTYNNSYIHQVIDSSSTSFSDQSVDYSHLHALSVRPKTEPANSKRMHANGDNGSGANNNSGMFLNLPQMVQGDGASLCSSPSKTPPWKPMSSFTSFGSNATPSKLIEPARQKLNFDDDSAHSSPMRPQMDHRLHVNHHNITADSTTNPQNRSRTPSPIGMPLWTMTESAIFKRRTSSNSKHAKSQRSPQLIVN